jgi:Lrp/AsnC family transcriptional regulator
MGCPFMAENGKNVPPELSLADREILRLLQADADMPIAEIAARVGLSASPCWRRIARLQKEGFIERKVAVLNARRLGLGLVVFANVKLAKHQSSLLREFEQAIVAYPEVTECYTMTGTMDYLLRIVTADIQSYERFLREHLSQMPAVLEVHSSIAITEIKYSTQLPL